LTPIPVIEVFETMNSKPFSETLQRIAAVNKISDRG